MKFAIDNGKNYAGSVWGLIITRYIQGQPDEILAKVTHLKTESILFLEEVIGNKRLMKVCDASIKKKLLESYLSP